MDIENYLAKDPTMEKRTDVIFFSAGFHILFLYRLSHFMWNKKMKLLARLIHMYSRIIYSADIHPAAEIEPGIVIDHGMGVVIGSTATVGEGTLIYHGVTLGARMPVNGKRHPDIGKNTILGTNSTILGPIKIGDYSRIGANTVVLKDVETGVTVAGIAGRKKYEI